MLIYPYDIYVSLSIEEEKNQKKLEKKMRKKGGLERSHSSMQLSRLEDIVNKNDEDIYSPGYLQLIFKNICSKKKEN